MKINHIVFTPFGVGVHDQIWLLYRLELLKNIVVPTLASQTNQNFKWIVFVDSNIPVIVELQLRDIVSEVGGVEIVRLNAYNDRISKAREIASKIVQNSDYVLQTRLDDDDAMLVNTFESLRNSMSESVENGFDHGCISISGGYDYFCETAEVCGNPSEELSIGLSIFNSKHRNIGIFDWTHNGIRESIGASGGDCKVIATESGGYLYAKHSLCDSDYHGMRARLKRAPDLRSLDSSDSFWHEFGLESMQVERLKKIFADAPVSFPTPAIRMTLAYDQDREDLLLSAKRKQYGMQAVLRNRLKGDQIYGLCLGAVANSICKHPRNSFFSGYFEDVGLNDFIKGRGRFRADVLVVDQEFIMNLLEHITFDQIVDRLVDMEDVVDYFAIVRWNVRGATNEAWFAGVERVLQKRLKKMVDVGGWQVELENPESVEKVMIDTARHISLNII